MHDCYRTDTALPIWWPT